MPGFKPHPQHVALRIAEGEVAEVLKLSVHPGGDEAFREVVVSEADLPNVKIADAVEGISGRGE